jgi:amino acid adenylation domain-containing protein
MSDGHGIPKWNAIAADLPRGTLAALFERQADRTPQAVAVRCGSDALTYAELDERANRLAHALARSGVGPETRVAVHLERSLELMVALLGTLKAGAAYVPLDPDYPGERLANMLVDAAATVLVTSHARADSVPAPRVTVLPIGPAGHGLDDESEARPHVLVRPAALAYVIFTSGSTGRPKGAMNTHESVVNRLAWMQHMYPLDSSDNVLQKTPISFDVSVWELFWPLLEGATLVLARPGDHRDPAVLARLIAEEGITVLHFVPSMLRTFLDEPALAERTGSLRRVFCSGEALPADLVSRFHELRIAPELHNLYGPTEAAVDVTFFPCPPGTASADVMPIGRPIANATAYVLDDKLAVAPVGVEGELFLGGLPLARGYAGLPGLTAERFVANPFGQGDRLYRTGDLARWRVDGVLEYLGRADDQVKIRGMRIEPGEIETALRTHPDVGSAAVVAVADGTAGHRLAAYVTARTSGFPDARALREHLRASLPEHMVPTWYVPLDALPLSPSGKLDRRALPAPTREHAVENSTRVPLAGPVEQLLAGIWREVTALPEVFADDDFFALGGHSLLAARVASRVSAKLGVKCTVHDLFEAPTVRALARRVTGAAKLTRPDGVPVVLGDGNHRASFGQERLWFLDGTVRGSAEYNLPYAMDVAGPLDVKALRGAFDALADRHVPLRTRFVTDGTEVRQRADVTGFVPFVVDDLRGLAGPARATVVEEYTAAEALRPFDLESGPLLRVRLLRLAEQQWIILLTVHHIIFDGWSLGILKDELGTLYAEALHEEDTATTALSPLPVQYADYAAWQRGNLEDGTGDAQLDYWRRRLEGAAPALELVTDRVRPAVQRHVGDSFTFFLGQELTDRLTAISRAHGVTPFMTLMAAFQLTLGHHAGVRDVCVGTPLAGRTRPEFEGLIGFFVNMLVIRTWWEDDPSFTTLLERVRTATLDAYENQDIPFEQVVDALKPPRDMSRNPLFQVALALHNAPVTSSALPGLTLTDREMASRVAKFDLTVHWEETAVGGDGLRGLVEYDVDLFDRAFVEHMVDHYVALLDAALSAPETRVSALSRTTPAEDALLRGWSRGDGIAQVRGVADAFRTRAESTPDAVALVFDDGTLTYAELRSRADALAERLVARGVTPESVVALAMGRSASLVVSMLAVLTAGAAYLPLDPAHPDARLAFMVQDSRASLVLADREVTFTERVPVVRIDRMPTPPDGTPRRIAHATHPEQRACVFYTSGSTGRPKGVEVTHQGIVRLVCDASYLGFGPEDVVAQVANVSFDAATLEIWGALLNGARVVGIRKEEALSPQSLRTGIVTHGITGMFLTTALFNQCVDASPEIFAPLRVLFFGGEAADPRRVAALRMMVPGLRLVHAYGPTEVTTFSTTYDVVETAADAARVPIGRPIADTRVHVLDAFGREAGIGVPGEVHLGGAGLARGYVGRPDLTAERFVPCPFGSGERLYRTGDVARWREDGVLDYLGRADSQVKIRGIRIEPEEIAGVLTTCPGVEAAVVDVQGSGDARRLVAYVVPGGDVPVAPRELRDHVATRLPDALVPAWYVTLSALPLTPNGKVDHRALPAPTDHDSMKADVHVPPRGAVEELVAQVWEELLDLPSVSVHDDFFVLGGHSLLAAQVVSRITTWFGAGLTVRDVFEAPTVAELARRVTAAGSLDRRPPISTAKEPYPLSFAQRRLWFLDRLATGSSLYNVPLALAVEGALDTAALKQSLRAVAHRQASLRTRFAADTDGEPRQVISEDGRAPLEIEDLRALPETEREQEAAACAVREAEQPFDLVTGPLFRARLLRLAEERFLLLVTMHHAISDGWSVDVLIRDLGELYAAAVGGTAPDLPALPVQYPDYAVWQRQLLDDGALAGQLAYWRAHLDGAPALLDLPTDRPRPAVLQYRGDEFPLRLSSELTARLAEVSRAHGVTRFMILMAVFQLTLGRYAGVRDVSVGTPVAGRTHPDLEHLIGFFANTLVIRTCWEEGLTFAGLLDRVRETTLAAYEHQDVPFEQVVRAVGPPRDPSWAPLFQVMLAMQDVPVFTQALPGLAVTVRQSHNRVAKFDLTVAWNSMPSASGELTGTVEYDVALFDRATVERMMGHYVTLLESALAAPQARLASLAMVDADAHGEPVTAADPVPVPRGITLHRLVGTAAGRWADRVALVQDGRSLTYAELEARADAVCAGLRARGVRAGSTVVVRMERSLDWPAALLGTLKAGAAYIPVDVHAPAERVAHVLRDARPVLVLGSRRTSTPQDGTVPFVAVEDALEGGPDPVREEDVHPAGPAYVLYTSGTTGRPKGVVVSHANAVHTLEAVATRYGLGPGDRVLQFAALTFDVAAEELFASLVRGAAVVMLPAGPAPGIAELVSMARSEQLSVLNLPASYWHEWVGVLDHYPPASCPTLRLVVVGSERVDQGKLSSWQVMAPGQVRWLNAYGPTETTITATVHEPTVAADPSGGTVPIGRPLHGVRAYVLDHALRPTPPGVPGDLYLGGGGVSLGYLGDPARTAECFLPDPWGGPGERMYATRDRVLRTVEGVLEFLGRDDDQVKLRGFRIELGEIEAALASHPGVRDAAAVLREDSPGKPELVGYAALTDATTIPELRAHLEAALPGYMVPAAIVTLDRLPRNDRGKTDRGALPVPARQAATAGREVPRSETERAIAAIWCEVLALNSVGADDNFFELGGHSLLIMRVQGLLATALDRRVPVVDLFRFPTVRALAQHLAMGGATTPAGGSQGRQRAVARKKQSAGRMPRRRTSETRFAGDTNDH